MTAGEAIVCLAISYAVIAYFIRAMER